MNLENKNKFYGEIIKNLREELESLTTKIKKTRENHDFGTYKNLILAYKEVLRIYKELIDDIEEKENNRRVPINYNIHVEAIKTDNPMELFKQLENIVTAQG